MCSGKGASATGRKESGGKYCHGYEVGAGVSGNNSPDRSGTVEGAGGLGIGLYRLRWRYGAPGRFTGHLATRPKAGVGGNGIAALNVVRLAGVCRWRDRRLGRSLTKVDGENHPDIRSIPGGTFCGNAPGFDMGRSDALTSIPRGGQSGGLKDISAVGSWNFHPTLSGSRESTGISPREYGENPLGESREERGRAPPGGQADGTGGGAGEAAPGGGWLGMLGGPSGGM